MTILLESDRFDAPQSHLDELSIRVTIVFLFVGGLTLVWSFSVDQVLQSLVQHLQPCQGECMNVYDPAQWSAVRWSTALLLGFISSLPLVLYHLFQFSKPGLLDSEYRFFKRWTLLATATGLIATYVIVIGFLPELYRFGFDQHRGAGLEAQYNTVHVVMLALYLVWTTWIFATTVLLLIIGGTLGLITSATADWFRLRIYGLGGLLILTTIPSHASSLTFPLLATYFGMSEFVGRRWYTLTSTIFGEAKDKFDREGRRRKFAVMDCSCLGANDHYETSVLSGCTTLRFQGLCKSYKERETVLDHAIKNGITDLVVTGCNRQPLPDSFLQNTEVLRIGVHGLDLMRLRSHRVGSGNQKLDTELAMSSVYASVLGGPSERWFTDVLERHGVHPTELVQIDGGLHGWGTFDNEVLTFVNGVQNGA